MPIVMANFPEFHGRYGCGFVNSRSKLHRAGILSVLDGGSRLIDDTGGSFRPERHCNQVAKKTKLISKETGMTLKMKFPTP
jgi:hypothetical protein